MSSSETEVQQAVAASVPAGGKAPKKKSTSTNATKQTKPSHPPTSDMVNSAIKGLKERSGSSLQAIKKYIGANYKVDPEKLAPFIKKYLKSAVQTGSLVQTKGKGASGSFKLAAGGSAAGTQKKTVKKAKSSSDDGAAKKSPSSALKAADKKKKKTAAASAKSLTAASKPKKTTVAEKKAPKAAKSPSKSKKTAKSPTKKPKAPKPKTVKAVAATKKAASPKKKK